MGVGVRGLAELALSVVPLPAFYTGCGFLKFRYILSFALFDQHIHTLWKGLLVGDYHTEEEEEEEEEEKKKKKKKRRRRRRKKS